MMTYFYQQLGPLAYPLLACALTTILITVERFAVLMSATLTRRLKTTGQHLLVSYLDETKSVREDIAAIWLHAHQRRLSGGIRLLHIIAVISPLLGLLGTVVGLIDIFKGMSEHIGPIKPAVLAGGLGLAMRTTAAGLIIAVPTLLAAHLFQLWVERLIYDIEQAMNLCNLQAAGVCIKALI